MGPTPHDLYWKVYEAREQLTALRASVDEFMRAYAGIDPAVVEADDLGEPASGPEILDRTRDALGQLARTLTLADAAWDEVTRHASRLRDTLGDGGGDGRG